ncbi:MAG: TetR family transcriptional regulator [Proteobacteria bacterium]|nr:TetR family transcriptional regulator [Pseudomonadota bacterium]
MTQPARRRDAAATRAAILASARKAFARAGYDGVGVREIAAGAGVTAMLVNRYFGSKEQLFAEVAADTVRDAVILSPENLAAADFPAALARSLVEVTTPGATPLDGFQMMLRSSGSPKAVELGRDLIRQGHQAALVGRLEGPHAAERAGIFLALVAGLQAMRQTLELPSLAEADPDTLAGLLEPLIRVLIDGPACPPSPPR